MFPGLLAFWHPLACPDNPSVMLAPRRVSWALVPEVVSLQRLKALRLAWLTARLNQGVHSRAGRAAVGAF